MIFWVIVQVVGGDVLNLRKIARLKAPVVSIGAFDRIFLMHDEDVPLGRIFQTFDRPPLG